MTEDESLEHAALIANAREQLDRLLVVSDMGIERAEKYLRSLIDSDAYARPQVAHDMAAHLVEAGRRVRAAIALNPAPPKEPE